MRPCLGNCHQVGRWPRGRCPACSRQTNQQRGSASARGYGSAWVQFRLRFIAKLIDQGILPVCGASLPDGPQTAHSSCRAQGLMKGEDLHLDHDPPLRDDERANRAAVHDERRIQLLCASCHNAKTRREQTHDRLEPSAMACGLTGGGAKMLGANRPKDRSVQGKLGLQHRVAVMQADEANP